MYKDIDERLIYITNWMNSIERKYGEIGTLLERVEKLENDVKELKQNDDVIADVFYNGYLTLKDQFDDVY